MTFDAEPNTDEATAHRAQRLHEVAVNDFGLDTDDVLFTARSDGTIDGRIAPLVAVEDGDAR